MEGGLASECKVRKESNQELKLFYFFPIMGWVHRFSLLWMDDKIFAEKKLGHQFSKLLDHDWEDIFFAHKSQTFCLSPSSSLPHKSPQ
jgi:hypothetical protein